MFRADLRLADQRAPAASAKRATQHYWRMRGSIAYVTGSHHAKFGYDGGYYTQLQTEPGQQLRS